MVEELCTSDDMEDAAEEVIEDDTNGIEDEETINDAAIDEVKLAWELAIELLMSGIEDEAEELMAEDRVELVT
jgi:hypothetical protein